MSSRAEQTSQAGTALIAVGALMTGISLLDFVSNIYPFSPGTIEWRYGAVGILSGFTVTPLLGVVLMMIGATWLDRMTLVRVVAGVTIVLAALAAISLVMFLLDGIQVRRLGAPERRGVTGRAVMIGAVKLAASIGVALIVAMTGFRVARQRTESDGPRGPIVGR